MTDDDAGDGHWSLSRSRDTLAKQSIEIPSQLVNALQLPSLSLGSELISPVPRTVSAENVSVLDTLSTLVRAIPSVGVVLLQERAFPSRVPTARWPGSPPAA